MTDDFKPKLVVHIDAERGFSGGELQVFLLMEGLRSLGVRNVLICPPGSRAAQEAERRGFECRRVSMGNDLNLLSVWRLSRALKRLGPDLVHLHTGRAAWLGGLAAKLARIPALATRRQDRRLSGARSRMIYGSLVKRTVAISEGVRRCLTEGGVPDERVERIYSSIDPAELVPRADPAHVRGAERVGADEVVILCLAGLVARKGLDVLLQALALMAEEEIRPAVWIAGDGPERDALEAQRRQLGLGRGVRLIGARRDVPDLLAACDLTVLPSRREGLGVAALESMAAGRAVVASRVGGLQETVVDGRTGFLVPPENPRALADALAKLCSDSKLRREMGAQGRERVAEGFLAQQMVAAYLDLYGRILAES